MNDKSKTPAKGPARGKAAPVRRDLGWFIRTFLIIVVAGTLLGALAVAAVFYHFSRDLPNIITVADYRPAVVTQVLATGGKEPTVIGEFYKERRYVVPYEKIPQSVVRAFTSAEDSTFFEHQGINLTSMIRASIANFRAGHTVQGGSTITQQVAKALLLTPEKHFSRKIKEVMLAYQIEKHLTKQQILYLYLNEIYLGHGAYGVQAAARTYFRKDIGEITVSEAAILAGLPQAPSTYSPVRNPQKAKDRQRYVLRRMMDNGYLTQAQMSEAVAQPVKIYDDENLNGKYAAYLVEQVRRYVIEKYGEDAIYEGGMTITVPTSIELAQAARKSLRTGLEAVDKRIGYRGPIQRLASTEEIEKFLKTERGKLIDRKIGHRLLQPDGKLDGFAAMQAMGLSGDAQLLDTGETYSGVVTSVDDAKRTAGVMIGAALAEMPFDKMKWARKAKDDKNPGAARPEPRVPSNVVAKGDVVLVKVLDNGSRLVVGLEQEPQVQGALLSIEAQTGYVLAMEGGYDFQKSEFNRALQAQRQPGSSFKPVIYTAALEKGFTPASILVDSPIVYEDSETGKWKPSNFEEKFYGDTTLRQALIKSRNIPTIKIMQALQIPYVIDFAKRIGVTANLPPDLSISLGSAPASLMDMTTIYALYPRLGRKITPIYLTKVIDRNGKTLEEHQAGKLPPPPAVPPAPAPDTPDAAASPTANATAAPAKVYIPKYPLPGDPEQVLDPRVAYVASHLMKEVVTYGTGHAASELNRPVAGKTGTTSDYIDAWFMGFSPHVVTGAWVGFDNQKSIGPLETGAKAALPIWISFMREAVKGYPNEDFAVPPGVVFATIDSATGKLAPPNASNSIKEAFIEGTQPTEMSEKSAASSESQGNFFKEDIE